MLKAEKKIEHIIRSFDNKLNRELSLEKSNFSISTSKLYGIKPFIYIPQSNKILVAPYIVEKVDSKISEEELLKEFEKYGIKGHYSADKEIMEDIIKKPLVIYYVDKEKKVSFLPLFYLVKSLIVKSLVNNLANKYGIERDSIYLNHVVPNECKIDFAALAYSSLDSNLPLIKLINLYLKEKKKDAKIESNVNFNYFKEELIRFIENYTPDSETPILDFLNEVRDKFRNYLKKERINYNSLYCVIEEHRKLRGNINKESIKDYLNKIKEHMKYRVISNNF